MKKDIKDKVLRDVRTLFESDEEDYYKPIRTGNAFSNNYIEYESKRDKDKMLPRGVILIKGYLNKVKPYLNALIDD